MVKPFNLPLGGDLDNGRLRGGRLMAEQGRGSYLLLGPLLGTILGAFRSPKNRQAWGRSPPLLSSASIGFLTTKDNMEEGGTGRLSLQRASEFVRQTLMAFWNENLGVRLGGFQHVTFQAKSWGIESWIGPWEVG